MLHILSQQMVLHLNHIMEVRQLSWVACKEGNVQSDAGLFNSRSLLCSR